MKCKRTAFFWVFIQQVVVIPYRNFGATYRSHLCGSRFLMLKMGTLLYVMSRDLKDFLDYLSLKM